MGAMKGTRERDGDLRFLRLVLGGGGGMGASSSYKGGPSSTIRKLASRSWISLPPEPR